MKDVPAEVLSYIMELLRELYFGEVVLIAQNGVLIQVERTPGQALPSLTPGPQRQKRTCGTPSSGSWPAFITVVWLSW